MSFRNTLWSGMLAATLASCVADAPPLRPDPLFTAPYENVDSIQAENTRRFLQERTGRATDTVANEEERLIRTIAGGLYEPVEANAALAEAKAIILADIHNLNNERLNHLFMARRETRSLINEEDKILLEGLTERAYNLRPVPRPDCEQLPIHEQINCVLDWETRQNRRWDSQDALYESLSPENNAFGGWLALSETGQLIGIDSRALKDAQLVCSVQEIVLRQTVADMNAQDTLHPFQEWVLNDLSLEHRPDALQTYLTSLPDSAKAVARRRQEYMNTRIIEEVKTLAPGARAYVVVGQNHVWKQEPALNNALQKARIPYFAFSPHEELIHAFDRPQATQQTPLPARQEEHGMTYFLESIIPWYIRVREAQGATPYTGPPRTADLFAP